MFCENCQRNFPQANTSTIPAPFISSTDLQKLLRSPYPPSTTQASEIPNIVGNIDVDIRRYDARIHQLRWEIIMLENKQKQLKNQKERYDSLLAPVGRLPTELLHHIFVMYINVEKMNHLIINSPASSWISLPGQKLMSVCARWREIAKSCKDLWTHIFLGLYSGGNADTNRRITAALQWCMDHAGPTAPLDIMLEWYLSDDTEKSVFCELLYSQASRWRNLTITSDSMDLTTLFPSFLEGEAPNFPLLEVIRSDGCLNLGRFHKAPKLHELSLSYPPDMDADGPVFPWTQIKTLNLDCSLHEDVVRVSPSIFPELESLSYEFSSESFEIPDFPSHTLNNLRSLSFTSRYGPPKVLEKFLESACYPALERMVIDLSPYKFRRYNVPAVVGLDLEEMVWPGRKVTSFILHSACSLTFLQLKDPFISTHDLLTLLFHTPALSHLDFYQTHMLEPTEEQLASNPVLAPSLTLAWIKRLHAYGTEGSHEFNNALLPKLTNLFLTVLGSWFDNDQLFVDVILSRWVPDPSLASDIGIACLKAVKLKVWGRSLDDKVYERVVQLGKAGMKVELSSEIPPPR